MLPRPLSCGVAGSPTHRRTGTTVIQPHMSIVLQPSPSNMHAQVRAGVRLVRAVCAGDVSQVSLLISEQPALAAVLTAACEGKTTALTEASRRGHVKMVRFLINRGAPIDQKGEGARTALLWACYEGRTDVVQLLLRNGADQSRPDKEGRTPLVAAAVMGHIDCLKALIHHGDLDLDASTRPTRRTALWWACQRGRTEAVRVLIHAGADPQVADWDCQTPLDVALWRKPQGCATVLLEAERSYCLAKARRLHDDRVRRRRSPDGPLPAHISTRTDGLSELPLVEVDGTILLEPDDDEFCDAPPHVEGDEERDEGPAHKRQRLNSMDSLDSAATDRSLDSINSTAPAVDVSDVIRYVVSELNTELYAILEAMVGRTVGWRVAEDYVPWVDEEEGEEGEEGSPGYHMGAQ